MTTVRKGLGKGLAALISEADAPPPPQTPVVDIGIGLIDPNPFQPRQVFDDAAIGELADSIKSQGLLQPILLRHVGERYQIIVGERRWRACRSAGLEKIPAIVRESATDEEMLELALLENVQRQDLNPIELAFAIQRLIATCTLTQEVAAEKLGMSRAHLSNTLRLLKLPERVQSALAEGKITMGHARALLALSDPKQFNELFERFLVDGRPTVREAEEITRRAKATTKKPAVPSALDRRQQLEIAKIEDRLRRALSTKVKIKPRGRGGLLEILFFTPEDLDRILDLLEK